MMSQLFVVKTLGTVLGVDWQSKGLVFGLILCGVLLVLQGPMLDGLSFDPFPLFDNSSGPAEVGIGGCHITEAFVVAPVVKVLGEGLDPGLKIAGHKVVFQQDAVFEGLVPALDFALGLGMQRCAQGAHRSLA